MEYDLINLFDHPLKFRNCIPSAIVTFGGQNVGKYEVEVDWRRSAGEQPTSGKLVLAWDTNTLRTKFTEIDEELEILRTRDKDRDTRLELTAVVVAVAVMAHIEPDTRFTRRLAPGQRHDYCLNELPDEMIEIAGRWEAGLPGLFDEKKAQSDKNQTPRKRWVSVTIFQKTPRNRTEGLHT
jgi:hypothetical protein